MQRWVELMPLSLDELSAEVRVEPLYCHIWWLWLCYASHGSASAYAWLPEMDVYPDIIYVRGINACTHSLKHSPPAKGNTPIALPCGSRVCEEFLHFSLALRSER
jgi:hypothetical protein